MLLYLNDKNSFQLKDLMKRYEISKSTAIRDIRSLEEIGMPIYSQSGRNGYYGILPNRLLSPIVFDIDEMFAMYFSMLTLGAYESTPFHLSVEQLKQKFEKCLSPKKVELLRKTEKVFRLGSISQNNHCSFLKDVLQFAIDEKVCQVKYRKKDTENFYIMQFFDISAIYGQWYVTGYNYQSEKMQVLRCDKILELHEDCRYTPGSIDDLIQARELLHKGADAIEFEVWVSKEGVDLFHKENYPSMQMELVNGKYLIRGYYNHGEEGFIANYFIGYGNTIHAVEPIALVRLIGERLDCLKQHFSSLISEVKDN